ncbi:hypothetical protein ATG66_3839 [Vibrio sp. ES.051]|nr:hypothetical protein ATG66_3839 [Vibrio sp. ES.051]
MKLQRAKLKKTHSLNTSRAHVALKTIKPSQLELGFSCSERQQKSMPCCHGMLFISCYKLHLSS